MVLNSLFTIKELSAHELDIKAVLTVNAGSQIFDGHFPGQPVVPGVCMMQLIKELIEFSRKTRLNMVEADNLKFLSVIDPRITNELKAAITLTERGSDLIASASLFADTVTFFKLKAVFKPADITQ